MLSIEYTSQLRRAAGVPHEEVEAPQGCTLQDLASSLAERHGEELQRILLDGNGKLQRSVLVFTDDQQVAPGANPLLRDGQTITFAAPISGG